MAATWVGGLALAVSATMTAAAASTTSSTPVTSSSTSSSTSTSTPATSEGTSTTGGSGATTTSTVPPPAPPIGGEGPSPTVTPTSPEVTLTAPEPESTTTPGPSDPTIPSTADPLVDEPPGDDAPETDHTVPPSGGYGGQGAFQPDEILWSSVEAAEAKLAGAVADRDEATRRLEMAIAELARRESDLWALGQDVEGALVQLGEAEELLQERAIAAFVHQDGVESALLSTLGRLDQTSTLESSTRIRFLEIVLEGDDRAIEAYQALRVRLDADIVAAADSVADARRAIDEARSAVEGAEQAIDQANAELEAFRAGSAVYIEGVVFPVADGYHRPLIDSWGFPRMPGTPDEHWHEGIDIFAPTGTPLLAAERAVVTRVGAGRLGGLVVWLRGESGARWYYAHLQAHAAGLAEGMVVEAGEVIGYVGNTGNAIGTPPHLHLELHPSGDGPVNPFPLLNAIADQDAAEG